MGDRSCRRVESVVSLSLYQLVRDMVPVVVKRVYVYLVPTGAMTRVLAKAVLAMAEAIRSSWMKSVQDRRQSGRVERRRGMKSV